MAALSMRARPVDNNKPLPVLLAEDVDLKEATSVQRSLPQVSTGMEKEEEEEHHIRLVINHQQVAGSAEGIKHFIPTPKADINVPEYDAVYGQHPWAQPKHYIRIQDRYLETDLVDYDLDTDDEAWLDSYNSTASSGEVSHVLSMDKFEQLMDRLERATPDENLISYDEARNLLEVDDYIMKAIYGFWKDKRRARHGQPLRPGVKSDRGLDILSATDPYIAFRRRTEKLKIQTRKNRQRDELGYERMLKLRRDFDRALSLLEMVKRREKVKRELINLSKDIFEKRYELDDWDERIFATEEELLAEQLASADSAPSQLVKRKKLGKLVNGEKRPDKFARAPLDKRLGHYTHAHEDLEGEDDDRPLRTGLTIKIPKPAENPFHFKKRRGVAYGAGVGLGLQPIVKDLAMRFAFIPLPGHPEVRCGRRRVGRGGRILVDRTPHKLQEQFEADPNHIDYFQYHSLRNRRISMSEHPLMSQSGPTPMAVDGPPSQEQQHPGLQPGLPLGGGGSGTHLSALGAQPPQSLTPQPGVGGQLGSRPQTPGGLQPRSSGASPAPALSRAGLLSPGAGAGSPSQQQQLQTPGRAATPHTPTQQQPLGLNGRDTGMGAGTHMDGDVNPPQRSSSPASASAQGGLGLSSTPQKSSVTSSPSADAGTGMHHHGSAAASKAQTPQPQQVTADNGPAQ